MKRCQYSGTISHNDQSYCFCAIIDKPNEITTLTIRGKGLEEFVASHGLIFSNPVDWENRELREEILARTVKNYIDFNKNIISKVHAEVLAEYEKEKI